MPWVSMIYHFLLYNFSSKWPSIFVKQARCSRDKSTRSGSFEESGGGGKGLCFERGRERACVWPEGGDNRCVARLPPSLCASSRKKQHKKKIRLLIFGEVGKCADTQTRHANSMLHTECILDTEMGFQEKEIENLKSRQLTFPTKDYRPEFNPIVLFNRRQRS